MAFPVLQTADTQSGDGDSSTITLTYPTNLQPGDLIIFQVGISSTRVFSTLSDAGFVWTQSPGSGSTSSGVAVAYGKKFALGTETGTFTLTFASGDEHVWRTFRITGWQGTLGSTFDNTATAGAVEMTIANGNNSTPDPPNLNPANWISEDTLWFALDTSENGVSVSVFPLTDNQYFNTRGCTNAGCTRLLNASSLDPSTFTVSSGQVWRTATIAIRPAPTPSQSTPFIGMIGRG